MKRRLFNLLTAVSLVLCVATVVLWVRSYFASDQIDWRIDQIDERDGTPWNYSETELKSSRGWLSYRYYNQYAREMNATRRERLAHCVSHHTIQWWRMAPTSSEFFWSSQFRSQIPLPYWSLAAIFSVLPLARIRTQYLRQRRVKIGHCKTCGYDLRATPERCPECGSVAAGHEEIRGQRSAVSD